MLTYEDIETHRIGSVTNITAEPVILEQSTLYPEATYHLTVTGSHGLFDSVEDFSLIISNYTNSNGEVTLITDLSPPIESNFSSGDAWGLWWRWGTAGGVYGSTLEIDSAGTSETKISFDLTGEEFPEGFSYTTIESTYDAITETATTFKSWEETIVAQNAQATTATQEGITNGLTFNGSEFVFAPRTYSNTVGAQAIQTKTTTTTKEVSATLTGNQFIATKTTAFGNTVLATRTQQATSAYTQTSWNDITNTVSFFSQKIKKYRTTEYGEFPIVDGGSFTVVQDGFYITNALPATTITFNATTTTEFFISATTTSEVASANIVAPFNSPPSLLSGTVVTSTESSYTSTTTTELTEIGLTKISESTTSVEISTIDFGPAATTIFSTITNPPFFQNEACVTFVRGENTDLQDQYQGFSWQSTGSVDRWIDEYEANHYITLSKTAQSVFEVTQTGFSKVASPLQTTKINVLTFGILDDDFISSPVTSRTLYFAPETPHLYRPIWANATPQIEETIDTYWVREFRNRINPQAGDQVPAIPNVPALLFGNKGEAFIPQGVYRTYDPDTPNGAVTFIAGNSVLANPFSEITAWRNLEYYTTALIVEDIFNSFGNRFPNSNVVATTTSFYKNDLINQPIDD